MSFPLKMNYSKISKRDFSNNPREYKVEKQLLSRERFRRKKRILHDRNVLRETFERGDKAVEQLVSLNPELSARVEVDSDFL